MTRVPNMEARTAVVVGSHSEGEGRRSKSGNKPLCAFPLKAESYLAVCVSVCVFFVLCVHTWCGKSQTQQHRICLIHCIIHRKSNLFQFFCNA